MITCGSCTLLTAKVMHFFWKKWWFLSVFKIVSIWRKPTLSQYFKTSAMWDHVSFLNFANLMKTTPTCRIWAAKEKFLIAWLRLFKLKLFLTSFRHATSKTVEIYVYECLTYYVMCVSICVNNGCPSILVRNILKLKNKTITMARVNLYANTRGLCTTWTCQQLVKAALMYPSLNLFVGRLRWVFAS